MPGLTDQEVTLAVERYGDRVLARCLWILRDRAEAEEAAQETFLRLWRYGAAFREADSKLRFLYRISDRRCFGLLSSRAKRPVVPDLPLDPADHAAQRQATPFEIEGLEYRQRINQLLDALDDDTRQIAVLRYRDELTQVEIAAETGWSRPTVIKRLKWIELKAVELLGSHPDGDEERP